MKRTWTAQTSKVVEQRDRDSSGSASVLTQLIQGLTIESEMQNANLHFRLHCDEAQVKAELLVLLHEEYVIKHRTHDNIPELCEAATFISDTWKQLEQLQQSIRELAAATSGDGNHPYFTEECHKRAIHIYLPLKQEIRRQIDKLNRPHDSEHSEQSEQVDIEEVAEEESEEQTPDARQQQAEEQQPNSPASSSLSLETGDIPVSDTEQPQEEEAITVTVPNVTRQNTAPDLRDRLNQARRHSERNSDSGSTRSKSEPRAKSVVHAQSATPEGQSNKRRSRDHSRETRRSNASDASREPPRKRDNTHRSSTHGRQQTAPRASTSRNQPREWRDWEPQPSTSSATHSKSNYKRGAPSSRGSSAHKGSSRPSPTPKKKCPMCEGDDHELENCVPFFLLDNAGRRRIADSRGLCWTCLRKGCSVDTCPRRDIPCKCGNRHHDIICVTPRRRR